MKCAWLNVVLCLLLVFSHSFTFGNDADIERYFQLKIMEMSQFWSEGKIKEGTVVAASKSEAGAQLKDEDLSPLFVKKVNCMVTTGAVIPRDNCFNFKRNQWKTDLL